MTGSQPGNGHFDPSDDDELDDDAPLDAAEEVAAAAEALAEADETLDERVESVVEDLDGVERVRDGESVTYLVAGRPFAVLMQDLLEVALDPAVAKAALRTANTLASTRGAGWIAFTPEAIDRFALDRAEAWLRSAHGRVAGS
jgi:antitoxin (DNA-binding transcriptional repressor) of toxin-antitoxin stability system